VWCSCGVDVVWLWCQCGVGVAWARLEDGCGPPYVYTCSGWFANLLCDHGQSWHIHIGKGVQREGETVTGKHFVGSYTPLWHKINTITKFSSNVQRLGAVETDLLEASTCMIGTVLMCLSYRKSGTSAIAIGHNTLLTDTILFCVVCWILLFLLCSLFMNCL